jgi:asparagine synthase (glutamine-hydrolysing)
MLATGFDSAELRRIARGDLAATLRSYDPGDVLRTHLLKAPPEKVGLVNAMRYLDFKLTLGGGILTKVDRASMAVSLEVRPVLLHPRMLALAARIPPERLASRQEAKTVLKSAVRPWLPRAIVDRPKMGFAAPLGSWLGGELAPLLESVRRPDARVASLVDGDYARGLVTTHQRGGAAFPLRLHSLFFLENWLETWH